MTAAPVLSALLAWWAAPSPPPAERTLLTSDRSAVVEMRTAALIMSGQEGGALPVAITALAAGEACGGDAGDCRFTTLVEIDGEALLAGAEGPLTIDVFAYVLGPELDVLALETLSLDLDPGRHRELLASTGLKIFLPFAVATGAHRLRVLAQAGEAFGVRGLELPAGEAPAGGVSPAILHQQAPWLLAVPAGVEVPLPSPFGLEAGAPLPAAREPEAAAVTAEAPADDVTGGDSATRRQTDSRRRPARAAEEAYAKALRQLAAGDRPAALGTLMAGEQRVFEALDADAVELLAEVASRVLARIPDEEWACVLPVVLLHLDASHAYRDRGRRLPAFHATRMTVDLADAYARKLAEPAARAEAASALSSLGGDLLQKSARIQAERLFLRALELVEDDATALFGLGALYEKRGLFERAVPVLERFHAVRPEYPEGALRLALNHARVGRAGAARAALTELTGRHQDDWITVLAYQELARLLIDGDEPAAAEAVLRRGLERWPDHPTLELQLAWVLEARDDAGASLQLLESLGAPGSVAASQSAGERSRYNRWPVALFAAGRQALDGTAAMRSAALARWLVAEGGTDEG